MPIAWLQSYPQVDLDHVREIASLYTYPIAVLHNNTTRDLEVHSNLDAQFQCKSYFLESLRVMCLLSFGCKSLVSRLVLFQYSGFDLFGLGVSIIFFPL